MPERPLTAVIETGDVLREPLSGAAVDRRTGPHRLAGADVSGATGYGPSVL
ncbi:unnamed protein product [[Actinomadura] parvosata subsp. kistnae]|uniref:hypothetical protein n=1 Tax=[Actinomadura] parvosata TaxID=1955412 RepID=UPI000D270BE5|nr:hypothetical protein [Nonomuraea sp. ATCC 55076]SPL95990.1 unnamed protein product [Actinomadura parvosata subsp. kistnae]